MLSVIFVSPGNGSSTCRTIRRSLLGGGAVALLATVTACAGDGVGSEASDTAREPVVQDLYRIGSVQGDRWDSFSRVSSVAFDEDGRLYVLDADARRITVVDRDGSFLFAFGRPGDGPGELRQPREITVLPSGLIAVFDPGHRGVLIFSEEGEFLRSVGVAEQGPIGTTGPVLAHGRDGLVFPANRMAFRPGGGPPTPRSDIPIQRASIEEDGDIRILHRAWTPATDDVRERSSETGRRAMRMVVSATARAFAPQVHLTVLPDGRIAVADSSTYRIRLLGADGETLDQLTRDIPPRAVTDRERRLERERQLRELEEGPGPQIQITLGGGPGTGSGGSGPGIDQDAMRDMVLEMRRSAIEEMEFWPEIPVIQELRADRAGRLWVRRFGDVDEPGPIDVVDPDEGVIATAPGLTFSIPDAFGPAEWGAWIEADELDVPYVRVGRIELEG